MGQMKVLLDTNIIIYLSNETLPIENVFQNQNEYYISIITYMESLGYSFSSQQEEDKIKLLLSKIKILYVDFSIASKVIYIKKNKKMKLPDAIIAATALTQNLELMTRNVEDFSNIENLKIINPFE
jgi:predicted nucleic acid-binding protein